MKRAAKSETGLPPGRTVDDVLSLAEAARWFPKIPGVDNAKWLARNWRRLPGFFSESERIVLFHPRTYTETKARCAQRVTGRRMKRGSLENLRGANFSHR